MEPLLISENLVSQFKFWADGQIKEGMNHGNELFQQVSTFQSVRRKEAYDMAWSIAQHNAQVVITATKTHYAVWVSLRSPEAPEAPSNANQDERVSLVGDRKNHHTPFSLSAKLPQNSSLIAYAS